MGRLTTVTVAALLLTAACSTTPAAPPSTTPAPTAPPTSARPSSPTDAAPIVDGLDLEGAGFEVIGRSAGGRALVAVTLGTGIHRVYVIGGIHGDERTGVETSRPLLEHLRAHLPDGLTVRWLLDANPDGSAARSRDNDNGVDINRNWPTAHFPAESHGLEPLSEPETIALLHEIEAFQPEVVVAMHSAREGPFANYDGPGERLAAAFASGAGLTRVWEVVPELDWPTPGSLGTHFGTGLGIPVVTVEGNRWDDPSAILPEVQGGLDAMLAAVVGVDPGTAPVCTDHRVGNACSELTRLTNEVLWDRVDGGTSGYLVKEAGGLVAAARWADVPIYPASSIKILHWLHVMRLATDDPADVLDTRIPVFSSSCDSTGSETSARLGDLVEQMLIASDNDAANAIQSWIGLEALDDTAASIGMVSTRVEHGFGCGGPSNDPANVGTIADLVTLYDGVAAGEILSGPVRDRFLDSMLDITAVVLEILDVDEHPDVRIVAKAGWYGLDRSIGGIAFTPNGTFVFGAYVASPQALGSGFRIEEIVAELLRDRIQGAETP